MFRDVNRDTVTITVNDLPTVGFTVSPSSTICKGSLVTLNGTGASSYVWTGGVINGVPFIPTTTSTFAVTGTNAVGCANIDSVTITVNASPKIVLQPISDTVKIDSDAVFIVASSIPTATFQWQQDAGSGFVNLTNTGQYSGVTNDSLKISHVTLTQNSYSYRCITTEGGCEDTSSAALLTVKSGIGMASFATENIFKVFPNPANDIITIQAIATEVNTKYIIYDAMGRTVLRGALNDKTTTVNISELASGFYLLQIGEMNKEIFKLVRQ